MRRRVIDVGLALGYAGLIFFLSAQSSFPVPKGIWTFDKVLHFTEYGVFAFLICRAIRPADLHSSKETSALVIAVILASLYGVSDEIHQYFVPGRSSEVLDAVADAAGSVMGAGAFVFHRRRGSRVRGGT